MATGFRPRYSMINRYRKTDTPAWQRRLVLLIAFLSGATVLLFVVWAVTLYVL